MSKYNTKSYCHDCGKEIEGENFYCNDCLEKNGLNKFNIIAFIITVLQPLFAFFLMMTYRKNLNPGIYKSCHYGIITWVVLLVLSFIGGFIAGVLGWV